MAKMKKRSQAMSDSSDEEKDGNTTPDGPDARGKTHLGGNSKGTCTQSVSPLATGPSVSQPPAICPIDKKTSQNGWSPVVQWAKQEFSRAFQPPVLENINIGEVNIHQPLVNRPPVIRIYSVQSQPCCFAIYCVYFVWNRRVL